MQNENPHIWMMCGYVWRLPHKGASDRLAVLAHGLGVGRVVFIDAISPGPNGDADGLASDVGWRLFPNPGGHGDGRFVDLFRGTQLATIPQQHKAPGGCASRINGRRTLGRRCYGGHGVLVCGKPISVAREDWQHGVETVTAALIAAMDHASGLL